MPPQLQQPAQPILAQPVEPALISNIGLTQPIIQAQPLLQQQQPPPIIPMAMPSAMPIIPNVQQPIVPIVPMVSQPAAAAPASNGALLIDSLVNIAPVAPIVPIPTVEPIVPVQPVSAAPVLPPPPTPPSGTQSRSMSFSAGKAPSIESPGSATGANAEWAVKGPSKLKYTQLFNTTDRTRSGFLTGAQARNLLLQSKLPQATLAQIWALSDIDSDGRLSCDEFVLAMYLCEIATQGETIPAKLPPELVPPSFRKTVSRHGSIASGPTSRHGSVSSQGGNAANVDIDLAHNYNQTTFEDKRKENFDKGQAELERRRKILQGKRLMIMIQFCESYL